VPVHVPWSAVNCCPSCGVPEIAGGAVFAGGAAATTAVGADTAAEVPATFDAVTATRSVDPMSVAVALKLVPVAPAISIQLVPPLSHRRHWYAYEMGAVPVHVPGLAVNVPPSIAEPAIVGAAVLTGGAAATTAVAADAAVVVPAVFDAVTATTSVLPISAPTAEYVDAVAPGMAVQFAPAASQRRH
jgi:hypothetical protein